MFGVSKLDGFEHSTDWNVCGLNRPWLLRLREEADTAGADGLRDRANDLPVFYRKYLDSGGIGRRILPRSFFH